MSALVMTVNSLTTEATVEMGGGVFWWESNVSFANNSASRFTDHTQQSMVVESQCCGAVSLVIAYIYMVCAQNCANPDSI